MCCNEQLPIHPETRPALLVLSGPSGAGKDAVLSRMKQSGHNWHGIVTATTRLRRPGERDGINYYFISTEKFWKMVDNNEFLEWAKVYGHHYGVPREEVCRALDKDLDVLMKVDVQGAATIKNILPQAVLIFITPPSREGLVAQLQKRRTESSAELSLRLSTFDEEIGKLSIFDYIVVNYPNKLEMAVAQVSAIATAEKCRIHMPKAD